MTIPEIRHCLHALANKIEAGEADDPQDTAAVLRYLAEQTRRAKRGSRRRGVDGSSAQDDPPEQQSSAPAGSQLAEAASLPRAAAE